MNARTLTARRRSALWGLLVGDALGVPYEFKAAASLPPAERITMRGYPTWDRSTAIPVRYEPKTYRSVPLGFWSDDGALALARAESLTARRGKVPTVETADRRYRKNAVAWYRRGAFACRANRFDVGCRTAECISAWATDSEPRADVNAEGNGSLMSVLPIALLDGTEGEIAARARQHSMRMHGPLSAVACVVFCSLVLRLVDIGAARGLPTLRDIGQDLRAAGLVTSDEWATFSRRGMNRVLGGGHAVDTLVNAWDAVRRATDFAEAVRNAILLGGDTDTTAAVTGALAALRFGGVPSRFMQGLQDKATARKIIREFLP